MFEIWDFPEKDYIFEDYMKTFAKLKYATTGVPRECRTNEDKIRFLAELSKKEGITLFAEDLQNNECIKNLAKFLMNARKFN